MFISLLPWKTLKETLPDKLDSNIIANQIDLNEKFLCNQCFM